MGIAVATYKVNGYSNKNVATIIVIDFSRQLKNWWGNYLTFKQGSAILNHTIEEIDEHGEQIQHAYETLSNIVTVHFIGNPQEGQAAAKTVLNNIRCPTLTNYR